MKFETKQIHAGFKSDPLTGSRGVPVYQTTSYYFSSSEHAGRLFGLEEEGNIYTRIGNPTTEVLENRLARLENGKAALALSSGHAAQLVAITTLASTGDNIVSSPFLYGGTFNQFNVTFRHLGIDARFTTDLNPKSFESLVDNHTRAFYVETIGNTSFQIPDFIKLSAVAKKCGIPLIVDNTFGAGGYLCNPGGFGADLITHSTTKWVGGHGTTMGGAIVDCGTFNWDSPRFSLLSTPSSGYQGVTFAKEFGKLAFITRARAELLRDLGPVQSPLNSFLLLQGLETLSLRVERQCSNALVLSQWLERHPFVDSVLYPGLQSHTAHTNALKYLKNGFGGVLCFTLKGGKRAASTFIDRVRLAGHMANVGDNRTLVIQPSNTTHRQLSPGAQEKAGVTPGQIRVSVGIEHIDDIINDFEQALNKTI